MEKINKNLKEIKDLFSNLSVDELADLSNEYYIYVQSIKNEKIMGIKEFYDKEYKYIPHIGDLVIAVDTDESRITKFLKDNPKEYYKITEVDYWGEGTVHIEGCEMEIFIYEISWVKAKNYKKWIPITERYPQDNKIVQVTYLDLCKGVPRCDAFAYRVNGKWHWAEDDINGEVHAQIIAWKYNCEPYHPD